MTRTKPLILGISTTRADYGHLYWPFRRLVENGYPLRIVTTGTHLLSEHGMSYKIIEADGFEIAAKPAIFSGNESTPFDIATAAARATGEIAKIIARETPDLVMLLGDRYEVLSSAQASLLMGVPVAHLAGGDITEGAFDDSLRHAITKLSHLHFPTNEPARNRIVQMGEDPAHVCNIGSTGIEYILNTDFLSRSEIEENLEFRFRTRNLLITYHPETLKEDTEKDFDELLEALTRSDKDTGLIFTRPNLDPAGLELSKRIESFAKGRENVSIFANLGSRRYLSMARLVDAVVGNSSSGLYEIPTLKTATVNIGDRQKGRLRATSVIDVEPSANAIEKAISRAMELDCSRVENPYGTGNASTKLVAFIDSLEDIPSLLKKKFCDILENN
ncbi:MAG TPA: UDP-N-acetylglucosamine 2-epimerase [Candidatus Melainabacteria bacterium]|nr:UDP-N-acetylglucosamine 2-epimerase [Candidatus Melainabacteria bacterium]